MKNSIKLIFAPLVLAGIATYAVHEENFNITNNYGEELHVKILDPATGKTLKGPIPVSSGDNIFMEAIPNVIFAHYPSIKDSECGLVLKPEELKEEKKCVYLVARPIRGKVRFTPLKEKENNIRMSSIREAKKKYEDWIEEMEKKGIKIEPTKEMVTPPEVMEEVETATGTTVAPALYCPKCNTMHTPPKCTALKKCPCQKPNKPKLARCSCQKPKSKPKLAELLQKN